MDNLKEMKWKFGMSIQHKSRIERDDSINRKQYRGCSQFLTRLQWCQPTRTDCRRFLGKQTMVADNSAKGRYNEQPITDYARRRRHLDGVGQ
jgi:hypothetical protein